MFCKATGRDIQSDNVLIRSRCCCKLRGYDTCSQPFGKPNICENIYGKCIHFIRNITRIILGLSTRWQKNVALTVNQGRHLLEELAREMNRLSEVGVPCLLTSIDKDYWSLNECCSFILRWADEVKNIHPTYRKTSRSQGIQTDRQLREAWRILSEWAASLKSLPEGSVCPENDVLCVLDDLARRWKMGQLPNMLPALNSIMGSVLMKHYSQTQQSHPVWHSTHFSPKILVC